MKESSPLSQLLLIIGLMIGGILLNFLLSFIGLIPVGGINGFSDTIAHPESHIGNLKFLQIIQSICLFILPAYFFARITKGQAIFFFSLNKRVSIKTALIIILIMIAAIPFINLLGDINMKMSLPSFLSNIEGWMKHAEERAAELTTLLVSGKSISSLLINLVMIAVLPAIGEELIFRGVFQRILMDSTRNAHLAVLIAAFVFSAFHLQFYGFLPRFMMGIILGYLYLYSGTLWLPILAHFINNAVATIFFFLHNNGVVSDSLDTIGTGEGWHIGVLSAGIILTIMFYLQRHKKELQLDEFK
jgi:membrane protease YdiL (CAAX protease family)